MGCFSQFSSVTQSPPTVCNPIDCSTPHFSVQKKKNLPKIAQTHVYLVGEAIQTSHPLSYPSPPAFNLSQNSIFSVSQFFTSGSQSIGASALASALPMNIQD